MGPVLGTDVDTLTRNLASDDAAIQFCGIPYLQEQSLSLVQLSTNVPIPLPVIDSLSAGAESRSLLRGTLFTLWQALKRFTERKNKSVSNDMWTKYMNKIVPFVLSSIR